jgi:hypothetical protein
MGHGRLSHGYRRDGFVVVPDLLGPRQLAQLREIIAGLVAASAAVDTHTAVYDLEPGHTAAEPRVRRIKTPHKVHPAFDAVVRSGPVMEVLTELLGPDLRLKSSKLNMKAARYGSPVEWHQDWAFYPHTNDDLLAIGVMLDDMDLDNGPLLVVPGSHKGPVWNHHGEDGRFGGLVDPADIEREIARSTPPSAAATCCLYEVAAADAWPLLTTPSPAPRGAGPPRRGGSRSAGRPRSRTPPRYRSTGRAATARDALARPGPRPWPPRWTARGRAGRDGRDGARRTPGSCG